MWLALAGLLTAQAAPQLALGVHGDTLTHPGLLVREAVPVAEHGALLLSVEAQGLVYWHPGLMTAAQLRAGPSLRLTGPHAGTWGAFAHAGVCHGWWTAPTWKVDGTEVKRVHFAGDSWAIGVVGLELGHEIEGGRLSGWAFRPQLGVRYPTFHGVGLDAGLELAVRFGGTR